MNKFVKACQTIKDLCASNIDGCFYCKYKSTCDLVFGDKDIPGLWPYQFPDFGEK